MNDAPLAVRLIQETVARARSRPPAPISTLRPGSQEIVEAAVWKVWPPRDVKRASGAIDTIQEAVLDDGTGQILLVLQSRRPRGFSPGDRIRVVGATVTGYSGHPRIVVGPTTRIRRLGPVDESQDRGPARTRAE
jgi:ssDNA-binding replication factor A large subunit